ncbi:AAA family ATPase [Yersinia ruckeri]|uniref:AAA family ATPase n=1 Tax=Yersinia ruckeri TaxID=29486 RepID=UPI002238B173|nr:AAA family ATPase [Yersinia ruckeri]MCW6540284.1 AAA family ATPase [Yersinia ruckeri]
MTFLNPTFMVNELKVFQHGHEAFGCKFHKGVNVLRGRNSSGKTTIMDLLAYSIGAENIKWKPEALLCTSTITEVSLNEEPACFKREISTDTQRPLSIFWGKMEDALQSSPLQWETYPFRRSEKSLSFSQIIFNALNMPLAQGEGASILTMHQILRVLYADQPSLHSPIFRIDSFDKALTRETVGDYLSGIFDDKLYSSQIRLKQVDVELTKRIAELNSIFTILGRSGQSENIHFIDEKIQELSIERRRLLERLSDIKSGQLSNSDNKKADKEKTISLRKALNKAKSLEVKNKDEIDSLLFDIADSEMFINELESRLKNINESGKAREYFGGVEFQFCPGCLSELEHSSNDCCHLCKSDASIGKDAPQLLRMTNEIAVQLQESRYLLNHKVEKLSELKKAAPSLQKEVKKLIQEYDSVSQNWESSFEIEFEKISRELGGVEEEIKQAYEHKKLSSVIEELQKSRDSLQSEKEKLVSLIESLQNKEEKTKSDISSLIENIIIRLLKLDLDLQVEFIEARQVKFSFEDNTVYVNGSKNFSESSAVILRHIFHLALLSASLKKSYMRLPRFMMLDGIDDGGMEKGRSHNLQKIIVDEASTYEHDFQLIFATSEINPEYEDTELTVGRYFNPNARSLNVNYTAIDKNILTGISD